MSEHRWSPGEDGAQKRGVQLALEICFRDYKTTIPIWQLFRAVSELNSFRWGLASRRWHWATVLGPVEGKRTHTACWPSLLNLCEACMPYGHVSQAWEVSSQFLSFYSTCSSAMTSNQFPTISLQTMAQHNDLQAVHCFSRRASCSTPSAPNGY